MCARVPLQILAKRRASVKALNASGMTGERKEAQEGKRMFDARGSRGVAWVIGPATHAYRERT
jgi:hypothetical protein